MRSRLFVGVCAEMTSMDNSEVYIAVALSFGLAVCLTVRWWFRRRRILWITAVALGSGYLRDDLLAAGDAAIALPPEWSSIDRGHRWL